MKALIVLIGACSLFFVPLALSTANEQASSPNEYQLPKYTVKDIATLPEPTHYPIPIAYRGLAGTSLKLKFTVNEKGRPESVRLVKPLSSYSDTLRMSFASQMRGMVSNWQFEPALTANNEAIAVKVILPVHVIKKADGRTLEAIATLILDDGSSDPS